MGVDGRDEEMGGWMGRVGHLVYRDSMCGIEFDVKG